jgi:HAD superfamily hydrolase (TIGR01490 family)
MSGAAVFDLDNTLVRGSCLFHFGVSMVRHRLVNPVHLIPFALTEFRYVHRRQEAAGVPDRIARCTLGLARGQRQQDLVALAANFVQQRLDRYLVTEIADLAVQMRHQGIKVYLATASPQELAEAVAARLGLTGAVGSVGEVVDGRYTGVLASPVAHGVVKALRVAELLATHGHDPAKCWAFSDSVNDLPLLTLVGRPVAVGPDRHLRRVAEQNGWPVLGGAASNGSDDPYGDVTSGKVVATSAASGRAWTATAAIQPSR